MLILLVLLGGALGTATRQCLSLAVPHEAGIPWTVFAINIVGSLLLGVLLESLIRNGPDIGRRRFARLFLGTGFLGGFTTYSALAVDTGLLFESGAHSSAIFYSIGSVLLGMAAAFLGILLGAALHRGRRL